MSSSWRFAQLLFPLLLLHGQRADGSLDGSCPRHAENTLQVQASVLLQTSEATTRRAEAAAGSGGHYNDGADNPEDDYMVKAAHLHEHVQSPKPRSTLLATGHDPESESEYALGHIDEEDEDFTRSSSSCLTEASFGATASEGSSCVFGVDDRDEGTHCIQDFKYGEFGWCYTQVDASLWGICSAKCPIYGPNSVLDKKLEVVENKLTALMEEVDAMPVKCKGPCARSEPKGPAKHGGKSAPSGKKSDTEPKEAKHGGKAPPSKAAPPPKQAKHGGKEDPSSKAPPKEKKEAKHGGKSTPGGEALLRQYRNRQI